MSLKELISYNPANTEEKVGVVGMSTQGDIKQAVTRAKKAFPSWKNLSVEERCFYYQKLLPLYERHAEDIARMQSREMGKPISQSLGESKRVIDLIKHLIEFGPVNLAPDIVDETDDQENIVFFEPYGVVAAILPWNFPSILHFESTMQAALAGNTIIVKHSEENPLTSKLIQDLFDESGFPEGVLQTVYGDGTIGQMLVKEDIDLIHFTGSSKTGESLYKIAADKFIPVVLEMGGSSPGIIFEDADLDIVCDCVVSERFGNSGQICCALKRLFVHENLYETVVKRVVDNLKNIKIGDPLHEDTTMGPLVAMRQLELIESQVSDSVKKGAKIEIGGKRPSGFNGAYYEPTILTNVTKEMRVYREETFGPVLPIIPFKTEEEAITLANETEYGLSAFIYTQNIEKAEHIAQQLDSGNVAINNTSYFSENSPFGGFKRSGIGSARGKYGFQFVTQMKTVSRPKK